MFNNFIVIIPARFDSERLPGKPLLDIAGKPMIQHVYERAVESGAKKIIVATDDDRIYQTVEKFGGDVCMTAKHHRSGTDRIFEVAQQCNYAADEIIVNVQGDEPLLPANIINHLAKTLSMHSHAVMATICESITDEAQIVDPNCVKVVMDHAGYALYFSRAPIPWDRARFTSQTNSAIDLTHYFRHVGLYAYRMGFLAEFVTWPPSPLEQLESLEQLRVLSHGKKIFVDKINAHLPAGVDTVADLERIRQYFAKLNH